MQMGATGAVQRGAVWSEMHAAVHNCVNWCAQACRRADAAQLEFTAAAELCLEAVVGVGCRVAAGGMVNAEFNRRECL